MGKKNKYKIFAGLSMEERVLRQLELSKAESSERGPVPKKLLRNLRDPNPDGIVKKKKHRRQRGSQADDSEGIGRAANPSQAITENSKTVERRKRKKPMADDPNSQKGPAEGESVCSDVNTTKTDVAKKRRKKSSNEGALEEVSNEEKTIPCKSVEKTSRRSEMIAKLSGARFRYINELLYTKTGEEAKDMFGSELDLFSAYHDGYQEQKQKWPYDPLNNVIKQIKRLPSDYVIADMGCGDAQLAASIRQKVYSFDLVAVNERVTATDMAQVPLSDASIDVCVFCLSLMGTNLADFICEANRILKKGGLMKIVEIRSRFDSIPRFTKTVERLGFKLARQVKLPDDYFIQTDYEKVMSAKKRDGKQLSLKPCLYKKR